MFRLDLQELCLWHHIKLLTLFGGMHCRISAIYAPNLWKVTLPTPGHSNVSQVRCNCVSPDIEVGKSAIFVSNVSKGSVWIVNISGWEKSPEIHCKEGDVWWTWLQRRWDSVSCPISKNQTTVRQDLLCLCCRQPSKIEWSMRLKPAEQSTRQMNTMLSYSYQTEPQHLLSI